MIVHGGIYAFLVGVCTLSQNLVQTYISIFLIGLLFVPRSSCIFTYVMEISPDKYHELMTLAIYMGDGITFVISGIFVMYTRDVCLYLICLSILTILAVIILWIFLPESPRFLYTK